MSAPAKAAAPAADAADATAPAKGKKKLIIIIAAAVLVLGLGGGGAAMFMMKKKAAAEAEADAEGGGHAPAKAEAKHDAHATPVFVPLDPFTVNLADREAERYAQIGITLEVDNAKTGEQIKTFMPAIRSQILLAIADRSANELLGREGKAQLALRIKRETSRAIGAEVADEEAVPAEADAHKPAKAEGKKKKKPAPELPVTAVHFSNFIVQ